MVKEDKKVLIVDDQMGIRRLLTDVLADEGYQVALACNGMEALEKVRELKPSLVLMDMKMPGMGGIEALEELRRMGLAGRVIMMTAYGELDMVAHAQQLGAYAYITKPFDLLILCEMVAGCLEACAKREREQSGAAAE